MPETEPVESKTQTTTTEIEQATEPEPVETGLTLADEVEVTHEGRGMSWTIISVFIGISVAAAVIAILKMTKVI